MILGTFITMWPGRWGKNCAHAVHNNLQKVDMDSVVMDFDGEINKGVWLSLDPGIILFWY